MVVYNYELSEIDRNIEYLKMENTILSVQVAIGSSLQNISKRAKENGFIEPTSKNILYVSNKY